MDVVLNGHDHSYEWVVADGVQQFVVGTGGRSLHRFESEPLPGIRVRHDGNYGLMWLALTEGGYEWRFLPIGLTFFHDASTGSCSSSAQDGSMFWLCRNTFSGS